MVKYADSYGVAVNPARAGMILMRDGASALSICKPRASGDDPCSKKFAAPSVT